jgi:hypothetical protein
MVLNNQAAQANQLTAPTVEQPETYSKISPSPKKLIFMPCRISQQYSAGTSLKNVITSLVNSCGWSTLIWEFDFDYHLAGDVVIHTNNIADALAQLLANYPLQAVFYDSNKVVKIQIRRD